MMNDVIMNLSQNTLHVKIALSLFPLENVTEMLPSVNKQNNPNCSFANKLPWAQVTLGHMKSLVILWMSSF